MAAILAPFTIFPFYLFIPTSCRRRRRCRLMKTDVKQEEQRNPINQVGPARRHAHLTTKGLVVVVQ